MNLTFLGRLKKKKNQIELHQISYFWSHSEVWSRIFNRLNSFKNQIHCSCCKIKIWTIQRRFSRRLKLDNIGEHFKYWSFAKFQTKNAEDENSRNERKPTFLFLFFKKTSYPFLIHVTYNVFVRLLKQTTRKFIKSA